MARERNMVGPKFIVTSADPQVPAGYQTLTGVLVVRLAVGEYGLFLDGKWGRYKLVDIQSKFMSVIPAGLPTGWWGILPRMNLRHGSYCETIKADRLQVALDQMAGLVFRVKSVGVTSARGLNIGSRETVSV